MANTSAVYVRIDSDLKNHTEGILSQLVISPVGVMTREQLNTELQKGVDSIHAGNVYSVDEVDSIFERKFGI